MYHLLGTQPLRQKEIIQKLALRNLISSVSDIWYDPESFSTAIKGTLYFWFYLRKTSAFKSWNSFLSTRIRYPLVVQMHISPVMQFNVIQTCKAWGNLSSSDSTTIIVTIRVLLKMVMERMMMMKMVMERMMKIVMKIVRKRMMKMLMEMVMERMMNVVMERMMKIPFGGVMELGSCRGKKSWERLNNFH